MFAFVQFVEDNEQLVVKTTDILKYETPFQQNKTYKVKYTDGVFYKAYIICTGGTKEEVRVKAQERRIRIPSKRVTLESTETEETDKENNSEEKELGIKKRKSKQNKAAQLSNFNKILEDFHEGVSNDETTSETTDKRELAKLKKKNEELHHQISHLNEENVILRKLNIQLQKEIIDKFKKIDLMNPRVNTVEERTEVTHERSENHPVGHVNQGDIHLGRNVWLPVQIFHVAMSKNSDSVFIKELACALLTPQTLMVSSVSGMACNKANVEHKPALDPTKLLALGDILKFRKQERKEAELKEVQLRKFVSKCLRDKIQDLLRPSRGKKTQHKRLEGGQGNQQDGEENIQNRDESNQDEQELNEVLNEDIELIPIFDENGDPL